jgi:exopolyphosphatase/guanosine-5'-triphosphate,3'-diphosphate pyrophosphatase
VQPRAVISLGTNTTRLLVIRDLPDGGVEQMEHGSIGTRLGEGLSDEGALRQEAMQRTLDAIAKFTERVRAHHAQAACIATSAMRRASNAAPFVERARELTGTELRILDGTEEATASFTGATFGLAAGDSRVAVLDIGGGSTECAVGCGTLEEATSLEIGAVRLAERFTDTMGASPLEKARAASFDARREAAKTVAGLSRFVPVQHVIAVGVTSLTLGAITFASNVDSVSGRTLGRLDIDAIVERLLSLTLAERRALPGMLPQRADILPGGALILSEVLQVLRSDAVTLQANDLLLGYLVETRSTLAAGAPRTNG